jgi:hypothetical protein|tara:strand:+ start:190 stop:300 length:111 start_codon:yes stop_codon:yes gene_type:complete
MEYPASVPERIIFSVDWAKRVVEKNSAMINETPLEK